jgi:hypothetical protein
MLGRSGHTDEDVWGRGLGSTGLGEGRDWLPLSGDELVPLEESCNGCVRHVETECLDDEEVVIGS